MSKVPPRLNGKGGNERQWERALQEFADELRRTLAQKCNGRVTLTLHLTDGKIVKPEIQRNVYPTF
jgi:hypothetical protein